MRRLTGRRLADAADERGAVAVFVTACLLALVGIGAYVIDVGALFEERRDLQNGADAAALAAAMDCVQLGICTSAAAQPEAERIASANSNDGEATVRSSDIRFNLRRQRVEVLARTLDAGDGDGDVDLVLAPVLGHNGESVEADAAARWSGLREGAAIPITISSCEWEAMVGEYDDPQSWIFGDEDTRYGDPEWQVIVLHDGNGNNGQSSQCGSGPGQDADGDGNRAEGGFGYLEADNCAAEVELSENGKVYLVGRTGNAPLTLSGCRPDDLLNTSVLVPIFEDITNGAVCGVQRGKNCYSIIAFAQFHITDIEMNSREWRDHGSSGDICPANDSCIGGYFEQRVELADRPGRDDGGVLPAFGVSEVWLVD